jgi:hypothetical protein
MKISELQQPYRRMAEYLAERNTDETKDVEILVKAFLWHLTDTLFWNDVNYGNHPEITEEIKTHFPADFDFSGEDGKNVNQNFRYISNTMLLDDILPLVFNKIGSLNSSEFNEWFNSDFLRFLFDKKHFIAKNNNELYTQLAKEGRFGELPETCEFSEPVELDVWDDELSRDFRKITGKFKGIYMDIHCIGWKNAQLPTKKIDFTQFKSGDVVEVELVHNETKLGWFDFTNENHLYIRILKRQGNQTCNGGSCAGTKIINKEKIKSITKIK